MAGNLDFSCDRPAKNDFTASTYSHFLTACPEWVATYYEWDKDGNVVPYGDPSASEQSHLDIMIKMDNRNDGRTKFYGAEIKERLGKYISTYYGEEGQEGWMYNLPKDTYLQMAANRGIIPLFANLYPDQKVTIWNIKKVKRSDTITKDIKRINIDPDSKKIPQERLQLWNKDGTTIRRINGN